MTGIATGPPGSGKVLEHRVAARRVDAHDSLAAAKNAEIALDTTLDGRADSFNPSGLRLAAIAACMIKGIERGAPMLSFRLRDVAVRLRGVRQDTPSKLVSIDYELTVDADETDHRLALLPANILPVGVDRELRRPPVLLEAMKPVWRRRIAV